MNKIDTETYIRDSLQHLVKLTEEGLSRYPEPPPAALITGLVSFMNYLAEDEQVEFLLERPELNDEICKAVSGIIRSIDEKMHPEKLN